jgi:hypothetical protein
MAKDTKEVKALTVDEAMRTDKSDWEYVEIPATTALGFRYDDFSIGHTKFESGKKHFVPPIIAAGLKERMRAYEYDILRINSDQRRLDLFKASQADPGVAEV